MPSCRVEPRDRTRNTTSWPLFRLDSTLAKSSSLFTGCLLTSRMMSPRPDSRLRQTSPASRPARSRLSPPACRDGPPSPASPCERSHQTCSAWACSRRHWPARRRVRAAKSLERSAIVTAVSCSLAVTQEAQIHLRSRLCGRRYRRPDRPLAHLLAINARDGVADFQPCLVRRTAATTLETVTPDPEPYTRAIAGFSTASNMMPIEPRETLCSGPVNWL